VKEELPTLLHGESLKPRSNLGTNAQASKTVAPKAIVVGAGFSRAELDDMRKCEGGDSIPWLYPEMMQSVMKTGTHVLTGGNFMDSIVSRAKETMKKNGLVEGKEDQVKPDVWGF